MNNKINQLLYELEKLKQQSHEKAIEIRQIYEQQDEWLDRYNSINNEIHDKQDKLYEQSFLICEKIVEIEEELFWIMPPVKSNGVIEIRKLIDGIENSQNNLIGYYSICLSGEKKVIGKIEYMGYHTNEFLGDVGFVIDPEYRGNSYAYHALCLVGELLKEKGIDDFWISAYKTNIPSVKTIEKYGGVVIKSDDRYNLYQAPTLINEMQIEKDKTNIN